MNNPDPLFPWEKDGGDDLAGYERSRAADGSDVDAAGEASTIAEVDASQPEADAPVAEELSADSDVVGEAVEAQQPAAAGTAAPEDAPDGAEVEARPDDDPEHSRFEVLDTEYARQAAERANAALRDKPIALKEYYSISEVCELVELKPHVLRYWETQFQILNPSKNRSGNRVYQRKEIRLIMLVKHLLYEEKYTVEGARAKLDTLRRDGELPQAAGTVLDRSMIEQLRTDLTELTTLLTPPAGT